jgi:HSP20 family protein
MLWREFNGRGSAPWRGANRLFRDLERAAIAPRFPAMNVWSGDERVMVTAELPGISPEEITISVTGDTLTLSGTRQRPEVGEGNSYHRQETGYGHFSRSLQLPFRIDGNGVEATFRKGVLSITLPRAEEDKPKKIDVRVS